MENQPEMIERSIKVTPSNEHPAMDNKICIELMQYASTLAARHGNMSVNVMQNADTVVLTLGRSDRKPNLVKEKISTRGIGSKYRRKERRRQQREAASSGYETDEQQPSTTPSSRRSYASIASTAPTSPSGTTTTSRRSSVSSASTVSTLPTPEEPSSSQTATNLALLKPAGPEQAVPGEAVITGMQDTHTLVLEMKEEMKEMKKIISKMDAEHKQLQSDMARMKKSSQDNVEHHEKLSHELISGLTSRMATLEEQQVQKKELRKPQSDGWRQQMKLEIAAQLKLEREKAYQASLSAQFAAQRAAQANVNPTNTWFSSY